MVSKPTIQLLTPIFRMSFPALIAAKEFIDKGRPTGKWSYQVEAIFDETDLGNFKILDDAGTPKNVTIADELSRLAKTAWQDLPPYLYPDQPESQANPKVDPIVALIKRQNGKGWPLKKGEAIKAALELRGKKGDQYAGKRIMSLKSNKTEKARPPILSVATGKTFRVLERSSEADMSIAQNLFVGGNYAFAAISIVADIVSGTRFLTPYLNSIRFVKDGPKFGGQSIMDRFDGIQGGTSDYDPTEGMTESSAVDL